MHKFYGQFTPPVDQFIFERYFPDINIKGVFVECGAFDGLTENSCKFFEETMGWNGFNIEPVPWVYEALCKNRPSSININSALSNKLGTATFQAVDHPVFGKECTNGSLEHTALHKSLLLDGGCKFVPVEVSLITWDNFIEKNKISCIDLLVLDVEGHEFSVIDGMRGSHVLPDVICIEVGHLDLREMKTRLCMLGYTYDISSHVNAFFIKTDKLSLFALRAAARQKSQTAEISDDSQSIEKLVEQNIYLTKRVEELGWLYREVTNSKLWKLFEALRWWRA